MFYCITRTLSNSLETVLTLVGLYYWPCMRESSSKGPSVQRKWGMVAAALACAIRPTSAITWAYVGLLELFMARDRLKLIFLEVVPIGQVSFPFLLFPLVLSLILCFYVVELYYLLAYVLFVVILIAPQVTTYVVSCHGIYN